MSHKIAGKKWCSKALLTAAALAVLAPSQPALARSAPLSQEDLLDRIQVEDMMTEYYALLTENVRHDIGDYFTEDAVLQVNTARFEGREAIRGLYTTETDPRILKDSTYHITLSNPRIEINGNTARMRTVWTGYINDNVYTAPRLVEQGTEETTFEKQDGVWMITSRTIINQGGMPTFVTGEL